MWAVKNYNGIDIIIVEPIVFHHPIRKKPRRVLFVRSASFKKTTTRQEEIDLLDY